MQTYLLRALENKLNEFGAGINALSSVYSMRNHYQELKSRKFTEVQKIFAELKIPDGSVPAASYFPSTTLYRTFRFLDLLLDPHTKAVECLDRACDEYDFLTGKKKPGILETEICFSAEPWDIATMSMRGITSCMSWSSSQATTLIGSIVDPYCAVIYLTDNTDVEIARILPVGSSSAKSLRGTTMLARSVVRYVLSDNSKRKPGLLLERLYINPKLNGNGLSGGILSDFLLGAFKEWLHQQSELPVHTSASGLGIPDFPELRKLPSWMISYRDSQIQYLGPDPLPKVA